MDDFFRKITKGRLYRFGDKLGDHMSVSLLWFLCCLPIITMVPSFAALYYSTHRRASKRSETPAKDFLHSFKTNLKQGIIINIIYFIYSAITFANIYVGYFGLGDFKLPSFYFPLSLLLLLPLIFSFPFVIPCLARYENTTKNMFINGFTMSTMYMLKAILTCLILTLTLAILIVFPPSVLFLPSLSAMLIENMLESAFKFAENRKKNSIEDIITEAQ